VPVSIEHPNDIEKDTPAGCPYLREEEMVLVMQRHCWKGVEGLKTKMVSGDYLLCLKDCEKALKNEPHKNKER
jgi:hypothetical protein